jgi:hypothetical protein
MAKGEAEAIKIISFYCIKNLILGGYITEVTEIPITGKFLNIKITEYKLKYYLLCNL